MNKNDKGKKRKAEETVSFTDKFGRDDRQKKEQRKNENGARRNQKGSMDRTGGHPSSQLCAIVWGSPMGFYSQCFRFEGGGRQVIGRNTWRWTFFRRSTSLTTHNFVVGLNRTGKSCRLRWVNYLHPGLKRGKMSPQEERLVLELHAKWGNRWSRIAHKLPGRTDNEIKNYWRTHMRKRAQERKRAIAPSSSSHCSSFSSTVTTVDSLPCSVPGNCSAHGKASFYDTGGHDVVAALSRKKMSKQVEEYETGYSMDDIWKDIELSEENKIKPVSDGYCEEGCHLSCPSMASPSWEYCWDFIWNMDEEESKMMINLPGDQLIYSSNGFGRDANLTG